MGPCKSDYAIIAIFFREYKQMYRHLVIIVYLYPFDNGGLGTTEKNWDFS